MMRWYRTTQGDRRCTALMDRHYSREPHRVGAVHFMPPGPALVLVTADGTALWGTSAPRFVSAQSWAGANDWPLSWVCSVFRNEGAALSSELIAEAVAATRAHFGEPPAGGMLTFVRPWAVRRKRDPGRCFIRAGFVKVGTGKAGEVVFALGREAMPPPCPHLTRQLALIA